MANKGRTGRSFLILLLAVVLVLISSLGTTYAEKPVKNVIFLMTDGTSASNIALARWYKGSPLALDEILTGAVRTYSAESVITDSAPGATAFATGHKSNSNFIGVLPGEVAVPGVSAVPAELRYKPVATVLEGARLKGKATGLVATSNIQHASPAAFTAHTPFRDQFNQIAKHQVYGNVNVVFGGGKQYLLPREQGGARSDGDNLIEVLTSRGYAFVETKEAMRQIGSGNVWGLFAGEALAYDMDRIALAPHEPSLAEMTGKAIELLSQNKKGFFLFVEASKVDWANHANEPIGVISDLLAYDDAVKVALDFAKGDGQTLVIACADHSTGGMTIGAKEISKSYDKTTFAALINPLKKAALTGEGVARLLGDDRSAPGITQVMADYYGITDLTADEIIKIQKTDKAARLPGVIGHMLSSRSAIGWVYTGHTGEDVFLYSYGPGKPTGLIENRAIAAVAAKALGLDLATVDKELFVEAEAACAAIVAACNLAMTEQGHPVLIIKKAGVTAELFIDTNLIKIGSVMKELPGLTIRIPQTNKIYIPQAAVSLLQ